MCRRIFKEQTSENGEIPFYKIGTFGGEADAFISRELFEEYKAKYQYPKKGDILISASGSIGRTVVFTGKNEYFQDSNIVWLNHDKHLDNSFLKCFYSIVKWAGIEGSTIKILYNDNILNTAITLPSVEEQQKIGAYFENLDNLITLHQREFAFLCKEKSKKFRYIKNAWEQRKVSELFRVTRGYVLAATQTNTTKTDEKPYPVYSSQTKDKGLMGYYKDYLYEDAITWTTDGANAGTVNYRAGKFYCTNVCGVLLSNEVKANQMIAEALNNVAKGYVSYVGNPKLMNNVMADIVIQIPTQAEEREMLSSLFASLDHLITLHQRKCDETKQLKKFMLQKMFPKNGEKNPEIRFEGFTDDWEQRKLGEVSSKITKKNQDIVVDEVFTNSAEYGIISQRDFFDKDIANFENIDGYYIVEPNDFVYNPRISTTAPFGPIKRNKLERTGAMSPLYYVFRPHDIDLSYLECFFQTSCWHTFMRFNGNTGARSDRFAITDKVFDEMPISMPQDIEEQQKIGSYFSSLDNLITLHQRKCEKLKELKKYMLQNMFV